MPHANASSKEKNPIMRGADPDAIVVDDTVWFYPTHWDATGEFFAYSSTDLIHWEKHGPILQFSEIDWLPKRKFAWAPGIATREGKFYLYYSAGPKPSHIGVAISDSPAGPFVDSGRALLSDDGDPAFEAIDAMVFTDPASGKSFFYAGGSAGATLRVFELNEDMISFKREIEVETPPKFTEGSFMHYHDGRYHFTYSHGFWGSSSYSVHHVSAPGPTGPWTYHGAILTSDDHRKGPGHHSVIQCPLTDDWLIIYHRWDDVEGDGPYWGHRQIAIDRLVHEENGRIRPVVMTNERPL